MSRRDPETVFIPCKQDDYSRQITEIGSTYFSVENNPYKIYTSFFIGNKTALARELKRREKLDLNELDINDESTFSGLTVPCTAYDGHSFVLIWLPSFKWTLEDFETLSHECLHAIIMVMRMSGVRSKIFSADDDKSCDDEGICYGQSCLFSSILNELVKRQSSRLRKKVTKIKKDK